MAVIKPSFLCADVDGSVRMYMDRCWCALLGTNISTMTMYLIDLGSHTLRCFIAFYEQNSFVFVVVFHRVCFIVFVLLSSVSYSQQTKGGDY